MLTREEISGRIRPDAARLTQAHPLKLIVRSQRHRQKELKGKKGA